ncbi:hypothetical protein FACS1894182_13440 [Bacteroidia bacterium]|nr:hypothetical protein FACS1894182_13440 [Bacteroidia bacterium]
MDYLFCDYHRYLGFGRTTGNIYLFSILNIYEIISQENSIICNSTGNRGMDLEFLYWTGVKEDGNR